MERLHAILRPYQQLYNSVLHTFAASHPLATEPLKQRCSSVVVDTKLFSDLQVLQH